uniref:Uncharacterized protein LOC102807587 n=1 Tax=Saccoglossus kowalevskii TaxID=10224 RepID=A0ABM0MQN9_SACKO|nr:PREDICTED: uncharacterized protein LOC102807587 [Saccoglossus kowalevskii]
MASHIRDPGYTSSYGRPIKLTDKALENEYEENKKRYEHAYRQLHGIMQNTYDLIANNGDSKAIHEGYKECLFLCERFLQCEHEYRALLHEDEFSKHESIFLQRREYIESFKSAVQSFFAKEQDKKDRHADVDQYDSVSQTSRASRKSKSSKASSCSTHTNISMLRLQEDQKRAEYAARTAAHQERMRLESAALQRRRQIDKEKRRLELIREQSLLEIKEMQDDLEFEIRNMKEEIDLKEVIAVSENKSKVLDQYEQDGSQSGTKTTYHGLLKEPSSHADETRYANTGDCDTRPTEGRRKRFSPDTPGISSLNPTPLPRYTCSRHRPPSVTLPNYEHILHQPLEDSNNHIDESQTSPRQTDSAGALNRLADILSSRQEELPRKEPDVFSGNVYDYPAWITSFQTLVEQRKPLSADRLYYLGKYTTGEAKDVIKGLLTLSSEKAYIKAKKLLAERYGDKLIVADTYKKQINDWPQIKSSDGKELRKFTDFLLHCETAMTTIGYLRVLNDPDEQKKVLRKIPKSISDRWMRKVDSVLNDESHMTHGDSYDRYPPFAELCQFLSREARIACSPANLKADDKKEDSKRGKCSKYSGARSFATEADEIKKTAAVEEQPTSTIDTAKVKRCCVLCKGEHILEKCKDFLKMKYTERKAVVMSKGLCMGCLKWGT